MGQTAPGAARQVSTQEVTETWFPFIGLAVPLVLSLSPRTLHLAAFAFTGGDNYQKTHSQRPVLALRAPSAACNPPDILVENHGSIFLFRPVTCLGQSWLKENVIGEETQIFGNAIVCEPGCVIDIVLGARAEGVVGPMTNEKPISLGEDDLKLMKELGVAVDPEHHWAARMAGAASGRTICSAVAAWRK